MLHRMHSRLSSFSTLADTSLLVPWSAFTLLTFCGAKVWALLPGAAEPRCVFSKVAEKRFPSKNEVISRLADVLQVCELLFPARYVSRAGICVTVLCSNFAVR